MQTKILVFLRKPFFKKQLPSNLKERKFLLIYKNDKFQSSTNEDFFHSRKHFSLMFSHSYVYKLQKKKGWGIINTSRLHSVYFLVAFEITETSSSRKKKMLHHKMRDDNRKSLLWTFLVPSFSFLVRVRFSFYCFIDHWERNNRWCFKRNVMQFFWPWMQFLSKKKDCRRR